MTYDEKLDLILEKLTALESRLAAIEGPVQTPVPPPTTGLYAFARPAVRNVAQFGGRRMAEADPVEAIQRALHGVGWAGNEIAELAYDEAWEEIEKLKSGDSALIARYSMLDPEFAGVALLSGLIAPAKYDAITFGVNAKSREALAGKTVASFLLDQFAVSGGPSGEA